MICRGEGSANSNRERGNRLRLSTIERGLSIVGNRVMTFRCKSATCTLAALQPQLQTDFQCTKDLRTKLKLIVDLQNQKNMLPKRQSSNSTYRDALLLVTIALALIASLVAVTWNLLEGTEKRVADLKRIKIVDVSDSSRAESQANERKSMEEQARAQAKYDPKAKKLSFQGRYPVYGIDLRGFGKWIEQPAEYHDDGKIDFKKSEADILRTLETLRQYHPNKPIFCLGESFGANMAIKLSSTHPHLIDGVIATAPSGKLWLHPSFSWISDAMKLAIKPLSPIKLTPYIKSTLSSDPEVTKAYIADSRICHYLSLKRLIKTSLQNRRYLNDIENVPKDMPILLIAGEEDKLFKTKSLPALFRKVGSQRLDLKILPGLGHLLIECQTRLDSRIASLVDNWLAEQSKPTSASTDNDHFEPL